MNRQTRIERILIQLFSPELLQIEDDSAKHAGHAGARPAGETHYSVSIQSKAFAGLSRVESHRLINDALKDEFATGLHALALRVSAP